MRRVLAASWLVLAAVPTWGLETDQYWSFGPPLRDATEEINAKVNFEIEAELAEINAATGWSSRSCEQVVDRIAHRFRFPFVQRIETWAMASPLVERVPATREEVELYRSTSQYSNSKKTDVVRWMPLSPTIEADGVRFGTDKLSHFFSQGASYHRAHRELLARGIAGPEAEYRALLRGTLPERTVLGFTSSGVLSRADLAANYQGMLFYDGLCSPSDPALEKTSSGWRLQKLFDLRSHISPDWDESWQPSVYRKGRWKRVERALQNYCGLLDNPEFRARREAYARRDVDSVADDVVAELVRRGKIPDPSAFTLERACGRGPVVATGPPVPENERGAASRAPVDLRPNSNQ